MPEGLENRRGPLHRDSLCPHAGLIASLGPCALFALTPEHPGRPLGYLRLRPAWARPVGVGFPWSGSSGPTAQPKAGIVQGSPSLSGCLFPSLGPPGHRGQSANPIAHISACPVGPQRPTGVDGLV